MISPICQKCKLHTKGCLTPFMGGSGSDEPSILFVGEAPGATEDEEGEPFVGKSGKLLREALEILDIENVRFTNTVRCRPPNNRTPTNKEIDQCSSFLLKEIEEYEPDVIVLLGNAPLKSVLGVSGITNYNGQVVARHGQTFIPAFHPAFFLHGGSNNELLEDWFEALEKAKDAAEGKRFKAADSHYRYLFPEYIDELEEMFQELISGDELIAYDIETVRKEEMAEDNKVITLAFANGSKAWSFPLDHNESWWEDWERERILEIVRIILQECDIITHTKFDCKLTRRLLNIDFHQYGDTYHLSRLLNAHHIEHGLKRLGGLHLGMFDYDKELQDYINCHDEANYDKGGHYGNVPLDTLLPYGGQDVSATWLLHDKLYSELSDSQRALYEQMIVPADYVLGKIESVGFKLDYNLINRYKLIYENIQDEIYEKLLRDKHVQDFIATRQKELDKAHSKKTARAKRQLFEFNPNSSIQVAEVLYERKNYPVMAKTPKGMPSVKQDLLKEIVFDREVAGESTAFLKDYLYWKLLATMLSKTYNAMLKTEGDWYQPDGRVRSNYILGGAKTGRIASRRPNLQNIPAVEKNPGTVLQHLPAKNAFTHTWDGGCLLMTDYAGMELRVMASVAGIQGMVDVFSREGDVHRYVSSLIYRKPENTITKFERYRGKWCNWSLLYRGNWWTLFKLYRINGLTEDEAKRVTNLYFKAFPELLQYHDNTISFLNENGFVQSPFGRVLKLPDINHISEKVRNDAIRTAVNMPIQGAASDTLMVALIIIDHYMVEQGFKSKIVNTVHDSLVTDIYPGELEPVVELQRDVMENVPTYAKDFMPSLDFSWLKVPLKADFDIGSHYGTYGYMTDPLECEKCFGKITDTKVQKGELIGFCPTCDDYIPCELDSAAANYRFNSHYGVV